MNCSSLKSDLFNLNIISDYQCECSDNTEDAYHFFFNCILHSIHRRVLFRRLNSLNFEINLNNILFGDLQLTVDQNVKAVEYIHCYISDSKRFY